MGRIPVSDSRPALLRRLVLISASILAGLYGVVCLIVYFTQERLVYFPGGPPREDPAARGLEYTDLELVTRDGERIHAWFLPAREARGTVVFCHGNAGNIGDRIPAARAFLEMRVNVMLFDYRGYGNSTGTPSEEGTYLDAEAAYDWLLDTAGVPAWSVLVYGESLGGGPAVELARRRAVAAVLLESTFTSIPDLGANVYPWLPVRRLARIHYRNSEKLPEVARRSPVLVIHSPEDDLVPFAHGERLHAVAGGDTRLLRTGGGHNGGGFLREASLRSQVAEFLATALERAERSAREAELLQRDEVR